jgi:hypothetical protein
MDRLTVQVRLFIFKICRFSNKLFLSLGATGLRSEWRARAPRRENSEGCFSKPRLLASQPEYRYCSGYKVYHLQCQCTAKCEDLQYICTLDFKTHFKLVEFLGSRTGTSCHCAENMHAKRAGPHFADAHSIIISEKEKNTPLHPEVIRCRPQRLKMLSVDLDL